MDELAAIPPPSQLQHGDGRTEPFDPDRLHHTLFAATKLQGKPDSFLSRELTDSILPFLAERCTDGTITTWETVEVAVAVLRELGHATLAQAVQETILVENSRPLEPVPSTGQERAIMRALRQQWPASALAQGLAEEPLTAFALEQVFPPHVAAAHREGLLTLGQLPAVRELAAAVVRWPEREQLAWLLAHHHWLGTELVFDTPEREWHLLQAADETRRESLREVARGCRLAGLRMALHLNCREPPAWARDADPPLFPTEVSAREDREHALQAEFLDLWTEFPETVRLFWHVHDGEAKATEPEEWLSRLIGKMGVGSGLALQIDRASQEIRLHDGLNRRHTALLHTITLHLDILVQRQGQTLGLDALAGKTLSLVRLALGAAKARREYLRRWRLPDWPAFVLDQALVCLRLRGLENVAERLTDAVSSTELHQSLAHRLSRALDREARYVNLSAVLDQPVLQLRGFTGNARELLHLIRHAPGTILVLP